jgi:hypothetical protein
MKHHFLRTDRFQSSYFYPLKYSKKGLLTMFGSILLILVSLTTATASPTTPEKKEAVKVDIGARIVLRPEVLVNPTSATPINGAQGVVKQGVRLSASLKRGPLKILGEFQDVRNWGSESSSLSIDPLAGLHQGYVEYEKGTKENTWFRFRAGRQEIRVGNGRFLAESPWQPAGRAYDGLRAQVKQGNTEADIFVAMTKAPNRFSVDEDGTQTTVSTPGDWMTVLNVAQHFGKKMTLRGGLLSLHQTKTEEKPTFNRDVVAPFMNLFVEPVSGLSFDMDTMVQAGSFNDREHLAWMVGGRLKYTMKQMGAKPNLSVMYEQSSGESCEGEFTSGGSCVGSKSESFFPFFGRNHYFRGIADRVGGINVRDIGAGLGVKPIKELSLSLEWHHFQLVNTQGAWYRNNGSVVGWDTNNTQAGIAHEFDLNATYKMKKRLFLQGALTVFQPVGAGKDWTGAGPQFGAYLWTRFTL